MTQWADHPDTVGEIVDAEVRVLMKLLVDFIEMFGVPHAPIGQLLVDFLQDCVEVDA
jgi:hypothetical protein